MSDLPIRATANTVYAGVSSPSGFDAWWTKTSAGEPVVGAQYVLDFGPGYVWRATVTKAVPDREFELQFTDADPDWLRTHVGFQLEAKDGTTHLRFYHTGWATPNDHYRTSCYCWPIYLRLLRRNLEHGEFVPYEKRLDV